MRGPIWTYFTIANHRCKFVRFFCNVSHAQATYVLYRQQAYGERTVVSVRLSGSLSDGLSSYDKKKAMIVSNIVRERCSDAISDSVVCVGIKMRVQGRVIICLISMIGPDREIHSGNLVVERKICLSKICFVTHNLYCGYNMCTTKI